METVTFDLTEGLSQQQDIEVNVLCANTSTDKAISTSPSGYTVFRSASWGMAFSTSLAPGLIFDFAKLVNTYDIIHIHLPNPLANLALWLTRPRCKIVLHWHSDIVKQKHLLKIYLPLQQWMLKRADAIIATSPPYLDTSPWLSSHKAKTIIIPIGTNIERQTKNTHWLESLRNEFSGKKIVLSLGRLTYYKGFSTLISAAALMPENVIVLIGGKGELLIDLQNEIRILGLTHRVKLLGEIPSQELGAYYELADVFCLPSIARSEAFGVVLLEAMAHAKPIVATKIPGSGVPWVNIDGETGINVEPDNPSALADAVMKILTNEKLSRLFGCQSRQRYQSFFTAHQMVERTKQLYMSLFNP